MNTKEKTTESQLIKDVFPLEAQELITKGDDDIVVLDVCTPKEFKTAHLENAINIDYFSKLFKARLDTLDKDKTYLVYCRIGGRSKFAQKKMKSLGFTKIYNIIGGTLLWEEEGLPFATGRRPSKWVACPFSITIMVTRKIRKAIRFAYGASNDFLKSIFTENQQLGKGGDEHVRS